MRIVLGILGMINSFKVSTMNSGPILRFASNFATVQLIGRLLSNQIYTINSKRSLFYALYFEVQLVATVQ
jgi:hypothetical protein